MIFFTVPGQPQGKGRARAFVRNGHVAHYTPEKTRSYEGVITALALEAMHGRAPSNAPLQLDLILWFEVPDSWPKWKRDAALAGTVVPTTKPDADNVTKAVKDALNGVVWRDDCQVVRMSVAKKYDVRPRVIVEVSEVEGALSAQAKRASH